MKSMAVFLFLAQTALFAKWLPMGLPQLMQRADSVVTASYISEINVTKTDFETTQFSRLRTIAVVKGDIESDFIVKSGAIKACVPNYIFQKERGRVYLLFLQKLPQKGIYRIVNAACGVLPVIDNAIRPCRKYSRKNFYGLQIR